MAAIDYRKRLLAMRAEIDSLLAELPDLPASPVEPPPEQKRYMRVADFAEYRAVSAGLVRKWIKLGLPVGRSGGTVRVKVAESDAWLDRVGSTKAVRDAMAAAGGR